MKVFKKEKQFYLLCWLGSVLVAVGRYQRITNHETISLCWLVDNNPNNNERISVKVLNTKEYFEYNEKGKKWQTYAYILYIPLEIPLVGRVGALQSTCIPQLQVGITYAFSDWKKLELMTSYELLKFVCYTNKALFKQIVTTRPDGRRGKGRFSLRVFSEAQSRNFDESWLIG